MNHHFNVLHLDGQGLRWAQFERDRGRLRLTGQGQVAGGPVQCLDAWLREAAPVEAPTYLYDSRQMVFGFRVELPRAALRRMHDIIPLRIRQELGLTEDAIFWTSRMEPAADRKQIRLRVFVVRRNSLEDVVQWRAERRLDHLWVGCDLAAINVLEEQRATRTPLVVVNAGEAGTTFYYADGQGRIFKGASPDAGARMPELGWGAGADRALFGREATLDALRANPALSVLTTAPVEGWLNHFENGAARGEGSLNDAVIIGGALVALARAPAMESLIADAGAPPMEPGTVEKLTRTFTLRQLVTAAALMWVALIGSVWIVGHMKSSLAERLTEKANTVSRRFAPIDESESAVLDRLRIVKADRMYPIFFDLVQAAPNGVTLQRLNIAENGTVQIDGTVQDKTIADLFRKSLSDSKLFKNVSLPEVQTARQGGVTFKLTAHLNRSPQ